MNKSARSIARYLAAVADSGTFASHFSITADPQLHVDGMGSVPLPVTRHTARQLCAVAQPAMHGYKDQTRLDPRVRDTWEIPHRCLRIDSPRWATVLDRAVVRIGRDLGLPPQAGLCAQLHNLLIYAPGQFFAVHQDSEKTDGMLGSLVITLPSAFTGGEFVVSHQGQTVRVRGSASRLGLIAFYADCRHEVRPVTQGYRIVLTYNLVAHGGATVAELPEPQVKALARDVRRFWKTPREPAWSGGSESDPPDRLVYLLDHQYTSKGLSWRQLKGADAQRAAALRQVADSLDAEIYLALADVHEIWSAEDDHQHGHDGDDEYSDGQPAREPELGALIDSDIELRHWLAPDGSKLEVADGCVTAAEVCMNRLSVDCPPFRSEYEGYMGNYGNTIDRWYHRAAVILWPRERGFRIRARQSPRWAIDQIAAQFKSGSAIQAREWVDELLLCWARSSGLNRDNALFAVTLRVAAEITDAAAALLLAPFSLQQLASKTGALLLRLRDRHGVAWCAARLRQWAQNERTDEQQLLWMEKTLPKLAQSWRVAAPADAGALTAGLVQERWDWLFRHLSYLRVHTHGSARTKALVATGGALLGLIRASHAAGRAELARPILPMLLSDSLPLQLALRVLRLACQSLDGAVGLGLASVHAYCARACAAHLARPARSARDWSIVPPAGNFPLAGLVEPLREFLASPERQRMEWPLGADKRQLVHQFIDQHELPVRHETRRSGRPFTLVLQKTMALFEHDAVERRQWGVEQAWLRQVAGRFA